MPTLLLSPELVPWALAPGGRDLWTSLGASQMLTIEGSLLPRELAARPDLPSSTPGHRLRKSKSTSARPGVLARYSVGVGWDTQQKHGGDVPQRKRAVC